MQSLEPGTRVGVYEVLSALGAGGMGEVYRARDTKLGRDVALKVLPSNFAHDPEPSSFAFGKPSMVFDFSDRPSSVYRNYDIAPDGSRFVIAKETQRTRTSNQFVAVINWFEEVKQRVPAQ